MLYFSWVVTRRDGWTFMSYVMGTLCNFSLTNTPNNMNKELYSKQNSAPPSEHSSNPRSCGYWGQRLFFCMKCKRLIDGVNQNDIYVMVFLV
jgi:hypothetical protein